jgi:hypothetical protein
MTRDEIARAFEVDFGIDKGAVGSVIEDYIRRKIDHEQLNRKLREIILKQHSFHGMAGSGKTGR